MIKDHHYTCAHPSCACRVTPPTLYCAEVCKMADEQATGDAPTAACDCGHERCVKKARERQA